MDNVMTRLTALAERLIGEDRALVLYAAERIKLIPEPWYGTQHYQDFMADIDRRIAARNARQAADREKRTARAAG